KVSPGFSPLAGQFAIAASGILIISLIVSISILLLIYCSLLLLLCHLYGISLPSLCYPYYHLYGILIRDLWIKYAGSLAGLLIINY
ncbi:MAG: hypothetical protein ACXVBH_07750, partial [Flavisolibacter sp.]